MIKENLENFIGTEGYLSLRGMIGAVQTIDGDRTVYVATDGVRYVMENGGGQGAFWLIQAILSYQAELVKSADDRLRYMQFWTLKVNADKSAVLTCEADSDVPPCVTQNIEYTDFDLPSIRIWVERGGLDPETPAMVLMLPSER